MTATPPSPSTDVGGGHTAAAAAATACRRREYVSVELNLRDATLSLLDSDHSLVVLLPQVAVCFVAGSWVQRPYVCEVGL